MDTSISYLYLSREERTLMLNEIALRKKALLIEAFPSEELLSEFLIRKDPIPTKLDIQWKLPQMSKFIVSYLIKFRSHSFIHYKYIL